MFDPPLLVIAALAVALALIWLLRSGGGQKSRPAARASVTRPRPAPEQRPAGPEAALEPGDEPEPPPPMPPELAALRLLGPDDLDEDRQQRIQELCAPLSEPHPLHQRVAMGMEDPDEVTELVSSDPGLTADVLRTVNSAAFALAEPINSVRHAVTFLGVNAVNGIIVRATLGDARGAGDAAEHSEALEHIWRSAYVASTFAQLIAQELGRPRPSVLATQALFFNIGDVALVDSTDGAEAWYRDGISLVDRIESQQASTGVNAPLVGAALARQWELPESIAVAIEQAYLPLVHPPDAHPLTGEARIDNVLVYLAGRVGDRVTYRGLADIGDLDLRPGPEAGTYYLAGHLEAIGLARTADLLTSPAFRRKANRFLEPFLRSR